MILAHVPLYNRKGWRDGLEEVDETMLVHFYATFRPIVGGKVVEVSLPEGSTVAQVLEELFGRFPELRQQMVDENGNLFRYVHCFVNGRDVHYLPQGLQTPLGSNDRLDIFPPVGGG